MTRKKVEKHLRKYDTANTLAYQAIKFKCTIKRDGMVFDYDPQTNLLRVSDGLTVSYYKPLITENEIDPFYKLL